MTTTVGLLSPLLPPTAVTAAVAEEHQQQDYYYVPQPQPARVVRMKMWSDDDDGSSYCADDNSTNSFLLLNNMGIHVPPMTSINSSMSNEHCNESNACKRRLSSSLEDDHIPKIARRMVNNEELLQNDHIVEQLDTSSCLNSSNATSPIVTAIAAVTDDSDCSIEDDDDDDEDDDDDDDEDDDNDDQYLPAGSLSLTSSNAVSVTNSSNSSLSPSQQHHSQNQWRQNHQPQQTIKCDTNGKCYLDLGSGGSSPTTMTTIVATQQRTNSEPECCELGRCVPATQCYRRRRAAVFDASMRKLGKSSGGSGSSSQQSCEAGLRRSVLICNTLRSIEREMSREAAVAAQQAQQRRCCAPATTSSQQSLQQQQQIDVVQHHDHSNNRRSPTPYPTEYRNGRPEMAVDHNNSSSSSSSSSSSTTDSIDSGVDDEYYYDEGDDEEEYDDGHIGMTTNHSELNNHHLQYYNLNGNIEDCDNYSHSDEYDEDDDEEYEEDDNSSSALMDLQAYDNNFNNKRNTDLGIGNHQCDDNSLPLMSNCSTTTITSIDWGSVLSLSSSNSNNNGNNAQSTSTSITLVNNIGSNCDDVTAIVSASNIDRKSHQHKHRRRHHKHHYNHNQIYNKHRRSHHSHHHQRIQKRRESRGITSSIMSKTKTSTNFQVLS